MGILEARKEILFNDSTPAELLVLADEYMQLRLKLGSKFELPAKHAFLKPVLEDFTQDLGGFLKFVASVRDDLPRRSAAQKDVQTLYRKLVSRHTNQCTRKILAKCVEKALAKGIIEDTHRKATVWVCGKRSMADVAA